MPKIVDHAERRRELIEASWDVIAAGGIEKLTLRNVAAAAGCTTGAINHYFEGREALLAAALSAANNETARRMLAIRGSDHSNYDKLFMVILEALPLDQKRLREWKVWMVFWAAAANNPELQKLNQARYKGWRGLMLELVHGYKPDCEPGRADELLAIIDGLGVSLAVNGNVTRTQAKSLIGDWLARL